MAFAGIYSVSSLSADAAKHAVLNGSILHIVITWKWNVVLKACQIEHETSVLSSLTGTMFQQYYVPR
jgi:hypothetical protein